LKIFFFAKNEFEFDSFYKKKDLHFLIKSEVVGGEEMINFIKFVAENTLSIDQNNLQSVYLECEKEDFNLRLVDESTNNRISITNSSTHGCFLIIRFPEPTKRFKVKSFKVIDNAIVIKCEGNDLYSKNIDNSLNTEIEYKFELRFQKEIARLITALISQIRESI
jgi:hypothetical protein